jgi:hypothetical protein
VGIKGPIPKRSDQRHGHRTVEVEKVKAAPRRGAAYVAPLAAGEWHPLAKRWWQGLRRSDQAVQYYQPSDWEHAYAWTQMWSEQLESGRPSAMFLATWDSAMGRLLVTEGDRRRVRIELERAGKGDPDAEAAVADIKDWRKKLAGA